MIQFKGNTETDGRREEWTDAISQDPFSYHQGSNKYNSADWHLKVKDKEEYDICPTKNYCITVSMQKINSIHTLIQQILGSHELMAMPISDHTHPKISEIK